jgi:hypothetical protein
MIGSIVFVLGVGRPVIRLKTASPIQVRKVGTFPARDVAKEYIRCVKAKEGIL